MTRTLIQKRSVFGTHIVDFFVHPIVGFLKGESANDIADCGRWKPRETDARNEQEENKGCETRLKNVFLKY